MAKWLDWLNKDKSYQSIKAITVGAFHIYQKLWETSMERSMEWRTCTIWHKFHCYMLLSPKFKMVTQISPWIARNWWFPVKTRKWNVVFHWKVSNVRQDYLFKIPLIPRNFPVERTENVFHWHPNQNLRNFLVNERRPVKRADYVLWIYMHKRCTLYVQK